MNFAKKSRLLNTIFQKKLPHILQWRRWILSWFQRHLVSESCFDNQRSKWKFRQIVIERVEYFDEFLSVKLEHSEFIERNSVANFPMQIIFKAILTSFFLNCSCLEKKPKNQKSRKSKVDTGKLLKVIHGQFFIYNYLLLLGQ